MWVNSALSGNNEVEVANYEIITKWIPQHRHGHKKEETKNTVNNIARRSVIICCMLQILESIFFLSTNCFRILLQAKSIQIFWHNHLHFVIFSIFHFCPRNILLLGHFLYSEWLSIFCANSNFLVLHRIALLTKMSCAPFCLL